MRRLILCAIMALCASGASAQSDYATTGTATPLATGTSAKRPIIAPRNAWAGATVAASFGDAEGDFSSKLNIAGQVAIQYWTPPGKLVIPGGGSLQIPFIANFAKLDADDATQDGLERKIEELAVSSEGVHFGVAPNVVWPLTSWGHNYGVSVYTYAGIRWNAATDTLGEKAYLRQGRFVGGVELFIGGFQLAQDKPGSLGVEVLHVRFDKEEYARVFGEEQVGLTAVEATFIMPVTGELGVLLQYNRFNIDETKGLWRLGLLLNPGSPVERAR